MLVVGPGVYSPSNNHDEELVEIQESTHLIGNFLREWKSNLKVQKFVFLFWVELRSCYIYILSKLLTVVFVCSIRYCCRINMSNDQREPM